MTPVAPGRGGVSPGPSSLSAGTPSFGRRRARRSQSWRERSSFPRQRSWSHPRALGRRSRPARGCPLQRCRPAPRGPVRALRRPWCHSCHASARAPHAGFAPVQSPLPAARLLAPHPATTSSPGTSPSPRCSPSGRDRGLEPESWTRRPKVSLTACFWRTPIRFSCQTKHFIFYDVLFGISKIT